MSHCPSCGGILGRDCFNPAECAEISRTNDGYGRQLLEHQIDILKAELEKHGIPIPDLHPKQESQPDYCFTDGLQY